MTTREKETTTNYKAPLLQIGGTPEQTITALTKSIVTILSLPHVDNDTKQKALSVLSRGVNSNTEYTTITNCSFGG